MVLNKIEIGAAVGLVSSRQRWVMLFTGNSNTGKLGSLTRLWCRGLLHSLHYRSYWLLCSPERKRRLEITFLLKKRKKILWSCFATLVHMRYPSSTSEVQGTIWGRIRVPVYFLFSLLLPKQCFLDLDSYGSGNHFFPIINQTY